uniref:Uncharacterized protein orf249 n=1 Tax=Nyctotherus ovalis TaxID=70075 RepID=F1AAJ8_NYCOV|nr:hypothetical protein [Nyctotherus ovalis]
MGAPRGRKTATRRALQCEYYKQTQLHAALPGARNIYKPVTPVQVLCNCAKTTPLEDLLIYREALQQLVQLPHACRTPQKNELEQNSPQATQNIVYPVKLVASMFQQIPLKLARRSVAATERHYDYNRYSWAAQIKKQTTYCLTDGTAVWQHARFQRTNLLQYLYIRECEEIYLDDCSEVIIEKPRWRDKLFKLVRRRTERKVPAPRVRTSTPTIVTPWCYTTVTGVRASGTFLSGDSDCITIRQFCRFN